MIDVKPPEDEKTKAWEEFWRRVREEPTENIGSDSTQDICDNLLNIATEIHKQNILLSDILREMRKRKM